MKPLRIWVAAAAIAGAALVSGCATSRTTGWEKAADDKLSLSTAEQQKLMEEGRAHWKKRIEKAELEKALAAFEKVARADSSNYEAHAYLTRGYYFLADGHLPDSQMDEKKKLWELGTSWGERALATEPAFRKAIQEEKKNPEDALDTLNKKHIEAIYWTAVNLGKWAKNSSISTALKYKTRVKKFIEKVQAMDSKFFYGAPDRYWGTYYAALPALFGGSLDKSVDHYKKSLKVANNYLGTHVLFADNYCRKKGDREGFRKALDFVLKSKADVIPELTAENTMEQAKAKALLAQEKEIFD